MPQYKSNYRLILDACCGTGESTTSLYSLLKAKLGHCLVIGIDKSLARLRKTATHSDNFIIRAHMVDDSFIRSSVDASGSGFILARADIIDFWLLAHKHNILFDTTYILYPNPYPKVQHIKRRWHGHPVFPTITKTTRSLHLRTNWQIYAQEWAHALRYKGHFPLVDEILYDRTTHNNWLSPFEKKYTLSSHQLWQVEAHDITQNYFCT